MVGGDRCSDGQPLVAVHVVRRSGWATDAPAEKEPRGDALLALANRVGEIFTPLLLADWHREPSPIVE